MSAMFQARFESGERDAQRLVATGKEAINEESLVRLDYLEIVDPDTLEPVAEKSRGTAFGRRCRIRRQYAPLSITFCCTPAP